MPPNWRTRTALSRFLLDENIPRRIAARLRAAGDDVVEAAAGPGRGSPDEVLWRRAATESRIFLTRDIGATALPIRPAPAAVILLRGPDTLTAIELDRMFGAFWDQVDRTGVLGHVVSVRPGSFRLRLIRP
jgi:predicted nuclease of predicted toxin-antitoxin system